MSLTTAAFSDSADGRPVGYRGTVKARKNDNCDGRSTRTVQSHGGVGWRRDDGDATETTAAGQDVNGLSPGRCDDGGNVAGTNACCFAGRRRITEHDNGDGTTDDGSRGSQWQWLADYCGWLPKSSIVAAGDRREKRNQPSAILRLHHAHHHRHHQHHHHHNYHHHHHHHTHHLHMWNNSCCWWLLVLYAAIVVVASFARAAHSAKDVPVYHVRAVAGQQARLPCDISLGSDEEDDLSDAGADSPPLDGESSLASGATGNVRDAVLLVLWYRDDLGTPIYSVDARSSATHTQQEYDSTSYHLMTTGAERWSDQRVFGDRAHFHVNGDSTEREPKLKINSKKKSILSTYFSSELRIDRVSLKDAIHLYRCRVDFRLAQTRNSKVNLTVVVPPDRMEIMDLATGRQLLRRQDGDNFNSKKDRGLQSPTTTSTTIVGPYVEGSNVRVRCRVYGGIPRPRVAWFRDNRLLKPESDDIDGNSGSQRQEVTITDGYAAAKVTTSSSILTGGEHSEEVIEVDLTLTGLTRSDLHTELTCQAWNYFYDDEDYSIIVTNSGTSNIDTRTGEGNIDGEVDPVHWTLRQRQSSLTAVVHVDMNFPPLTVQILPITENGHFRGVSDGLQPPPFTQSSAKMTPLPSPDNDDRLTHSSNIQEQRQLQPLTAGRKYELPCRAYGSRPPAKLTWWMDGRRLDTTRETTSSDGNSTTSVLTFVPVKPNKSRYQESGERNVLRISDFDGKLTCRAENPQHQQQSTSQHKNTIATSSDSSDDAGTPFIQSTWLLRIQYVPETQITLGTNLRADDIREGTDVYFDCTVDAVPPAYKVQWKRDGIELHHNAGGGSSISGSVSSATIIISNQSLVLQGVSRREAGHYTCGAENAEGPGPHSKPIYLDVLYPPTCTPSNSAGGSKAIQRVVYGVAKKETVTIACHVQANPPPTEYRWSFNNTISSIATSGVAGPSSAGSLIKQRFSSIGHLAGSSLNSSRTLTYAPRTDFDYGTVECWARNRVGMQTHPCVYHVIAAGRPDRVTNCTVVNSKSVMNHNNGTRRLRTSRNSGSHILIRCTEGYDGGLPQRLWAEIREAPKILHSDLGGDDINGDLVQNITGIDEDDQQSFSDFNENKKSENAASPPIKVFVARGLKLGAVYRVDVLASNAKGKSEPLTLMISVPLHGATGADADESNQNGISNTMTTIEGQDPDRARKLLLEQQREQERDRRLQEDNDGGIGNFRMTRAMAIVLLVAGSLVVVACGVATFLRYRKDDDEDGDTSNGESRSDRAQSGSALDGSVIETRISSTCISGTPHGSNKTMAAEQLVLLSQQANGAKMLPNNTSLNYKNTVVGNDNKTTAVDKEYHSFDGGNRHLAGGDSCSDVGGGGSLRNSNSNVGAIYRGGMPLVGISRDGLDTSTGTSPSRTSSAASVIRSTTPCSTNAYSVSISAVAPNDQAGSRASLQQSYHRNPDIIPAPVQIMSPGTVYNNYNDLGDPNSDSMTLIVASSTSSSPIHNHRQQQFHHNRGYNNNLGQYHQGVMTLRRPVVINTQYYSGGGNTLHRNSLKQPDPIVMVKDASSGTTNSNNYPLTVSSPAAAYCTLPRASSYHNQQQHQNHNLHNHHIQQQQQQQQLWLQQQQQHHHHQQQQQQHQTNYHRQPADSEVDAVEPPPPPWPPHNHPGTNFPTVILVPSPPLPSPPAVQPSSTLATAMVQVPVVVTATADKQPPLALNKKESAV